MAFEWRATDGTLQLFGDGRLIGAITPFQDGDISSIDELRALDDGVFEWTRRFTLRSGAPPRPVRLTLEFVATHACAYGLIPAVSYNGNAWGSGQDPKGFTRDGVPWAFAYHRTPVPGATYSEGTTWSVALFGKPPHDEPGFSCTLLPRGDTTSHRLIWPEIEEPVVYSARDEYAPPFAATLTLEPGRPFIVTAYLVVAPRGRPRTAWRRFLDVAWRLNDRPLSFWYRPEQLWELGVRFVTHETWAEEGVFRGFSVGLLPTDDGWMQRDRYKYEIGWAGQNASLANSLLHDFLRRGDRASLAKGLAALDCWPAHARLSNGLIRTVFDPLIGEYKRRELHDACNLGNAAEYFLEAFELARRCGFERPAYREMALGICDFALRQQDADGRLGKAWSNDGTCADPNGTIGCCLVPALLAAYRATGERRYLDAGARAYRYYAEGLLRDGFTTAGALDTHCIDKESAYPLIEAGLALHDLTDDAFYLEAAEHASYYTATWQYHYSVQLPGDSTLAALRYDSFGGTSVSTQHHHLDPYGVRLLCAWLRLAQKTGNFLWWRRALAAWANGMIGLSGGTLVLDSKRLPAGGQCEGYFHTRWINHGGVSLWLVVWPDAFRLEMLRRLGDWRVLEAG